jgi:hypothetical protein
MNLFKLSVLALVSAISFVSLANPSSATMPTVKKVDTKVQVQSGPIKVIPFITPENDPRYQDTDYDEAEEYEYNSDDDHSQYYEDHPQQSEVETGNDSQGGHWGLHYDTDDNSEYDKDSEPHWGYHFDDDDTSKQDSNKHYGHHKR